MCPVELVHELCIRRSNTKPLAITRVGRTGAGPIRYQLLHPVEPIWIQV